MYHMVPKNKTFPFFHFRFMTKKNQYPFWLCELRDVFTEITNSHNPVALAYSFYSRIQLSFFLIRMFFQQERFIKLLDPQIWSLLLSPQGFKRNPYFKLTMILDFVVVAVVLYRLNNRNMVERKNRYLIGLLPIPINSIAIETRNDMLEESFWSSHMNRLIVSFLSLPKVRKSSFLDPKDSTWVLPITNWSVSNIWSELELNLNSNPTKRSTRDQRFLKKEQDLSFALARRAEKKEMVNLFKIIPYLQKSVSIHPISSDSGCDRGSKGEPDMGSSNTISFFSFDFFHVFHDRNRGGYTLHHESEERFQEMEAIFTLLLTEPDLIQSQYRTYGSMRNVLNRFFFMNRSDRNFEYGIQRDKIGKDTLNDRIRMKSTINQDLSNWKKSPKKGFDPLLLISRTEGSANRDPDKYRYRCFNESKDLFQFESPFQVVFDGLRMNPYSIELKSFLRYLSNSFLFLSFGNIPTDRSEKSKLLIEGGAISPFLFKKWMSDSFPTIKNRRQSLDSYFSMIDQDNWLNPVKPFHRSLLLSAFYKANRLRFLNNSHHLCYCSKRFPFCIERAPINNSYLTYRQFLNILFIRNKRFPVGQNAFLERDTILPIESQVSKICIPNPQSGDERYNFSKSFQFPTRSDRFLRRTIYSIADISGTPLTEGQIVNFERTDCQPLSAMNLSDSERKNLQEFIDLNSNMGSIHLPDCERYLPPKKKKKRRLFRKKALLMMQLYRAFEKETYSSILPWEKVKKNMPYFFTWPGFIYINRIVLQDLLWPRLRRSGVIFLESIYLAWRICQRKLCLPQWKRRISEISGKSFLLKLKFKEGIPRKNESTIHLRFPNAREFLYSIPFLLLVAAAYLFDVRLFLNLEILCMLLEMDIGWNRIGLINETDSKPMESWVESNDLLFSDEKQLWLQLFNLSLSSEKSIDQILWNLTHSDHFSKKEFGYQMSEQPGAIYLRYLFDLHNKSLISYKVNSSSSVERRVLASQSQAMTTSVPFSSRRPLFPFRRNLSPPRGILVVGSVDIGQSYWVKYLATNCNLPFITITLVRNLDQPEIWDQIYQEVLPKYELKKNIWDYFRMRKAQLKAQLNQLKALLKTIYHSVIEDKEQGKAVKKASDSNQYRHCKAPTLPEYGKFLFDLVLDLVQKEPEIKDFYSKIEDFERSIVDQSAFDFDHSVFKWLSIVTDIANYRVPAWKAQVKDELESQVRDEKRLKPIEDPFPDIFHSPSLYISSQFEIAKVMAPCILCIPDVEDLFQEETSYLSRGLVTNFLNEDFEEEEGVGPVGDVLVIASTSIPQRVDPRLLDWKRFQTCIQIRSFSIPQQRKHFFTLSDTRGFHLEKKMFYTNEFWPIDVGYNSANFVALTNEALSISITQNKSILDTNTIRFACHRKNWNLQSQIASIPDHVVFLYQIARAIAQRILLGKNCPIDRILSIYENHIFHRELYSYVYKWFFELGMSIKRVTIFIYLLSCSAGLVAQNLRFGPDDKRALYSFEAFDTDSELVRSLLALDCAVVVPPRSQFDNDRLTLPFLTKRTIKRGTYKLFRHAYASLLLGEIYRAQFDNSVSEVRDPTFWSPTIWDPHALLFEIETFILVERKDKLKLSKEDKEEFTEEEKELEDEEPKEGYLKSRPNPFSLDFEGNLEKNDVGFLAQFQIQDRFFKERGFMRNNRYFWYPSDPDPFLRLVDSDYSEEADEGLKEGFKRDSYESLLAKPLVNHFLRSKTLCESYEYLSSLLLSNQRLLDQMAKTLLRKRWLFPDEMKSFFMEQEKELKDI
uniref:Uncharacterized protein n=1 Tax=Drosera indica TaxID=16680 RepID=A0A411K363_9CARY|nr:hypothetical protein RF2 [Drosera indica]QBC71788.1 hypothetical protein RF2 [Drosera indica]